MEEQISQLWTYAHTIAGTAVGGFAFLLTRLWDMNKNLKESLELKGSIDNLKNSVDKIEGALIGSYDQPDGLVQRHQKLYDRLEKLENEIGAK